MARYSARSKSTCTISVEPRRSERLRIMKKQKCGGEISVPQSVVHFMPDAKGTDLEDFNKSDGSEVDEIGTKQYYIGYLY